jgi:hypothetical protein
MSVLSTRKRNTALWLLALAGVCQNLSAAWFGLIFISPGLALFQRSDWPLLLTANLLLGMVMLYLSVLSMKQAQKYE